MLEFSANNTEIRELGQRVDVISATCERHEPRITSRVLAGLACQVESDLSSVLGDLVRDHGQAWYRRAGFREGAECNRELVHTAEQLEVWLLSWLPGQITPIHDHGGALTVTAVLSGTVLEERFERTSGPLVRPTWTTPRAAGDIDRLEPAAIHRVRPLGKVVTLHLYAPARTGGQIYQPVSMATATAIE
jgi:predicted metal-dependent enzyme (double-stranded beta helix superfamily)